MGSNKKNYIDFQDLLTLEKFVIDILKPSGTQNASASLVLPLVHENLEKEMLCIKRMVLFVPYVNSNAALK